MNRAGLTWRRGESWLLAGVMGLAFFLWTARLDATSVWVDERNYLQISGHSISAMLALLSAGQADYHPPLYLVLLNVWRTLGATSESATRALSVLAALIGLPAVYLFARQVAGRAAAGVAGLFVATSALSMLYFRMIRYFAVLFTAGTWSILLFWRWATLDNDAASRTRMRALVACGIGQYVALCADYPAMGLILAQNVFVLAYRRQRLKAWLACEVIVAALYVPWLLPLFGSVGAVSRGTLNVLAREAAGYALKVVYPLWAYAVGETNLPWNPLPLAGALAALLLAFVGARALLRRSREAGMLVVGTLGLSIALIGLVVSTLASAVPFTAMPTRVIFVFPLFAVLVGAGVGAVWARGRWIALGALGLVLAANGSGIANYLAGRQFVNPLYAVPMREISADIAGSCTASDLIIAEWDTSFDAYFVPLGEPCPWLNGPSPSEVSAALDQRQPNRVWLLQLGRDTTRASDYDQLRAAVDARYVAARETGYVEQDPTYRQVKSRLLGRDDYRYKLVVTEFQRR